MSPAFPTESWIRDVEALRRVARSLLGRELADDAIQAVALTALQRPPRIWNRSWLLSVLRHRAIDEQRAERRRAEHHESLEPGEPAPAADDIVARLETHERLSAAIRALPPASREAVYLRYFDDLPPREIAARLGLPVKTVQSRLHRALADLRGRLDGAERGTGRDWRVALAAIAVPQPASAAVSASTLWILGGLDTMKRLAIALVLLVGLWGIWVLATGAPASPPSATVADRTGSSPPPSATSRSPALDSGSGVERVAVGGPAGDRTAAGTVADADLGTLTAHVLWHDGVAAPAVGLALSRGGDGRPYHAIDYAVTDEAGSTRPMTLPAGPYRLRSPWDFGTVVEVVAGETTDVRIDLPRGIDVDGEVVDGDGRAVADAAIWMQGLGRDWTGGSVIERTDRAGRFRLRSAPEGVSLGALAAGFAPSTLVDLDLVDTSSSPAHVRLVLDHPGGTVRGVVSAASGEPVAAAVVCVGPLGQDVFGSRPDGSLIETRSPRSVRTDDRGEFELHGLPLDELPLAVRSSRHPIWNGTIRVEPGEPAAIAITLADPASLAGVVTDDAGTPMPGAIVHVFAEPLDERFLVNGQIDYEHVFGHEFAVADGDGRYRVANVAPGPVHAHALRGGSRHIGMSIPRATTLLTAEPGQLLEWNAILTDGHVLEGIVLYRDGKPMDGAFVTARDEEEPDAQLVMTTDRLGRFRFVSVQDHAYSIGVQVLDLPDDADPVGRRGVHPDEGEIRIVATFDAPPQLEPGRVIGRLDDAAGLVHPPGAFGVTMRSEQSSWWTDVEVDGDRFVCEKLDPGRYVPVVSAGQSTVFVGDWFELAPGEELDIGTLTTVPTGSARLRIVRDAAARGLPATIQVMFEHAMHGHSREIEAETEIWIDGLPPGTHRVFVHGAGIVSARSAIVVESGAETAAEVRVRAGVRRELQVHFPPALDYGRLRVTVLDDASGETVWTLQERSAALSRPYVRRTTLPLGRFRFVAETTTGRRAEIGFDVTTLGPDEPPVRVELR